MKSHGIWLLPAQRDVRDSIHCLCQVAWVNHFNVQSLRVLRYPNQNTSWIYSFLLKALRVVGTQKGIWKPFLAWISFPFKQIVYIIHVLKWGVKKWYGKTNTETKHLTHHKTKHEHTFFLTGPVQALSHNVNIQNCTQIKFKM